MTTEVQPTQSVDAAIAEMVKIIVEGWDPQQIILFGSRARGDYHQYSDVDLVVVLDEAEERAELARQMSAALECTGIERDIFISTPADVVRQATVVGTVERAAMFDGRTLYVKGRGDPVMERYVELMYRAGEDIRLAEAGLNLEPPPLAGVCYHTQQAIEKVVKAALMVDRIDYPFVHDLERLLPLVPIIWDIDDIATDPRELSTWASYPRYSLARDPTPEFARQSFDEARAIHERVSAVMVRRGLPLE